MRNFILILAMALPSAYAAEPVAIYDPFAKRTACPAGFEPSGQPGDRCEKIPPRFVDRGIFGGCPAGYVAHPSDPRKCTLPVIAERILRPRR